MLAERLASHETRNEQELWAAMETEWSLIPQSHIRSCIHSMPRRLREVVRVRGDVTEY